MEVQVTQRYGEEHNKLRRGPKGIRINSSDVPVICGMSKYQTPTSLWDFIIVHGGDPGEPQENENMVHGKVLFN